MIECIQCGTMVEIDIMEDHIKENHPKPTRYFFNIIFDDITRKKRSHISVHKSFLQENDNRKKVEKQTQKEEEFDGRISMQKFRTPLAETFSIKEIHEKSL